ncbi:MAG: twin-arginine translocase TatA/TatE family subunit [Verrucomicrobia bacterium]|nr:twin-arginine translocase TatA/TatE family subunit [Verrucomicrobiota bacterium]MBV8377242.1 twin-arginine translocase TatA/TatE family subunit [Verrucomicrobiota bacterium]
MYTIALVTPGPTEWVLILVIVLVLFGAKKLPELARSLGQSMNEFRKAREEFDKELHQAGQDLKLPPQSTQPYQPAQPVQQNTPVQSAPVQTAPVQPAPAQPAQAQPPSQTPTQPS